jgi:hypothetical protein
MQTAQQSAGLNIFSHVNLLPIFCGAPLLFTHTTWLAVRSPSRGNTTRLPGPFHLVNYNGDVSLSYWPSLAQPHNHSPATMASFGKVLDLLDERYLNIQDVIGYVEPLPTLVPYEEYTQNVLVYRMDTNLELFMALIQDFTERKALETGKELWTWCVQWEVDNESSHRSSAPTPSPKKPRLDIEQASAPPDEQGTQSRKSLIDIFERCILPSGLIQEEDMLRILIDIVQVDSSLVPNFIEFLYRWVDYYEGDGKALKAAMRWEIPSLWEFEYHPLVLPTDVKRRMEEEKLTKEKADDADKSGEGVGTSARPSSNSRAEDLAQGSPTKKMREKPNVAEMERQVEESERLQYREVKFGLQPPKMNRPLPPLVNIPQDRIKRIKYYAACFKSRQRALVLLLEAGITMQQMGNYVRLQEEHPRDTPGDGDPKILQGLRNYHKDAAAAQQHFDLKEKLQLQREKQKESSISYKLAIEAQLAASNGVSEGLAGFPLIPPTPYVSHSGRSDMATAMMAKLKALRTHGEERINVIPTPLVGRMKSKLFDGAKDRQTLNESRRPIALQRIPHASFGSVEEGSDLGSEDDDDSDENTDLMINQSLLLAASATPTALHPNLPQPRLPLPRLPLHPVAVPVQPAHLHTQSFAIPMASGAAQSQGAAVPQHVADYMRTLTPEQAQRLLPLLNPAARQAAADRLGLQVSNGNAHALLLHTHATHMPIPGPNTLSSAAMESSVSITQALQTTQTSSTVETGEVRQAPIPFLPLPKSSSPTTALSLQPPRPLPPPQLAFPQQPIQLPSRPALPQIQITQPHASSAGPTLSPPRPGIQRNAPLPLNLMPPPASPFSSFAPSLLATTPFAAPPHSVPIQIYLPKIIVPGNGIGPGGARMGNNGATETDAFLVGHLHPGSAKLVLSRAIFMPVGVWENTLTRVRKGKYDVLETYAATASHPKLKGNGPSYRFPEGMGAHEAVYKKFAQVYNIMRSSTDRERDLTKRWRATKGPMTQRDRGAVWEGWAVCLDREIEMGAEERRGAFLSSGLIDEGVHRKAGGVVVGTVDHEEVERRRREMEELMEEDEDEEMEDMV